LGRHTLEKETLERDKEQEKSLSAQEGIDTRRTSFVAVGF